MMPEGQLARLQAAVARWPHLYDDGGYYGAMYADPESTRHRPAECARLGGRCALADSDLDMVVKVVEITSAAVKRVAREEEADAIH